MKASTATPNAAAKASGSLKSAARDAAIRQHAPPGFFGRARVRAGSPSSEGISRSPARRISVSMERSGSGTHGSCTPGLAAGQQGK